MKIIEVKDQTIAIISDRQTFARMHLVQQSSNLDIRRVLKYELGADPHAVANLEGSLRRSVESKLMVFLENDIRIGPSLPSNTIFIFDGMAIFQKLSPELKIFGEILDEILQWIFIEGGGKLLFFVAKPYFENSIKLLERDRRNRNDFLKASITRWNQAKPLPLNKFLKCSENKEQFTLSCPYHSRQSCLHHI